ncbi:hypothetical protein ACLB1Q_21265 [Escherichia coli]
MSPARLPLEKKSASRLRTLGQVAWHFPLIQFSPGRQLPQLADELAALGQERSVVCPLATRGCFCPITAASARS